MHLYDVEVFKCFDGSREIPNTFINDDFCDCSDGSDEPGTSACRWHFYCSEKKLTPHLIPSSMVGDGVCGIMYLGLL